MNTVSSFRTCLFNLQGFSKNDPKLQMIKLLTATKFHDIIGMLEQQTNFPRLLRPDSDTQPIPRNNGTPEEVMPVQAGQL